MKRQLALGERNVDESRALGESICQGTSGPGRHEFIGQKALGERTVEGKYALGEERKRDNRHWEKGISMARGNVRQEVKGEVGLGRKEFQWLVGLGRNELPALGERNFKGQLVMGERKLSRQARPGRKEIKTDSSAFP